MRLSIFKERIEKSEILYENEDWEREIVSLFTDSRQKVQSGLFFCLCGGAVDSHTLATQAVENGAVAVVTQRALSVSVPQLLVKDCRAALSIIASLFYGEPSKSLSVIGITGTNGKTTTSYMLRAILEASGKKTGIIGTLGASYGQRSISTDLTTPDPIPLQQILAEMVRDGVEYVVMEVSAHALHYKKTVGVRFAACIFSNLTQDHLDFFATMSAYKGAKMQLFSPDVCPIAIINGDEVVGREIGKMRQIKGAKTLFYGLNTPTDAFAIVTDDSLYSSECMLNIDDKLCRVRLLMTGRHNVYNALSAAACAMAVGVDTHSVAKGLGAFKGVKGRLQRIASYHHAEIYVDFAHTPDGLEKSLLALKGYCRGRLICLFGCGGNRDKGKRPLMGEKVAKGCDFAVLTSDNPRYEDPLDIIKAIENGYRRFSLCYVIVPQRERAIEYALDNLRAGDILLIAGKGGEDYQEIMGIKYPFNDQDTVIKLLEKKGKDL